MVNQHPITSPVGPLKNLAGISLFPSTIRASIDSSNHKDLESIHNFMKSMEVQSPGKFFEEARAIVDNGSELLNTKFTSFVQSMGIKGEVAMKGEVKPQERRPGLGRKRAQFSLKLSTSQPSINLEPSLDIDQLSDPTEFFTAVDRLEDAEREIKRQKGSSIFEPDMNNLPTNARPRRPGILGKSVRYKHRFSSTTSDNEDVSVSSQGRDRCDVLDEPNSHLPEESPAVSVEFKEAELTESIAKSENRVNELLDELLSSSGEDLEGDRALSILQERLHMKPIKLGTLIIPEFSLIGKTSNEAFGERVRKPKKSSLEMHNLVKRTADGTPSTNRQNEGCPDNTLASPTPSKTPFASLSSLKRCLLQKNPLKDPFSPLNAHLSSSDKKSEHQPHWPMKMNLKCRENDVSTGGSHRGTEDYAGSDNMETDDHSDTLGKVEDVLVRNTVLEDEVDLHTESSVDCRMHDAEMLRETSPSLQTQGKADDLANCSTETDLQDFGSTEMDQQVDMLPKTAFSAEQDCRFEDSTTDKNLNNDHAAVASHSTEVRSTLRQMTPEQLPKKHPPRDKQQKAKRPAGGRRERKALSYRPSLAECGTSFENGIRRSKRMKTRPLEYWKGERLLYGRVNDSVKLVGLRYISPTKGSLEVKSYVSDECKEVVDLAARY